MKPNFREYLRERVLLADGAIGTYLYAKGIEPDKNIERLNLSDPDLVYSMHEEYIRAGSRLLETNTFGANRLKLEAAGLADKTRQINQAGAQLALRAAGSEIFVAGSVGPSGVNFPLPPEGLEGETARLAFREQIQALLDAGVDLLILETFSQLDELLLAIQVSRELAADIPIVASMVHPQHGKTAAGLDALTCGRAALAAGADVVGSNCGRGARAMLAALEQLSPLGAEVPLAAFPNAGFPEIVDHRLIYPAEPPYMARLVGDMVKAGARLVGGCCGTTPAHIQEFGKHLRLKRRPLGRSPGNQPRVTGESGQAPGPGKAGALLAGLPTATLPILVELDPPTHLDISGVLGGAQALAAAGANAITLGENPLAVLRADNISLAHRIRSEVGIPTVAHLTCRDRNALGLQSQIMGAHLLGIEGILAVTGDPASTGDQPGASGVFDVQSFGLIRMLSQFNQGRNPAGKELKGECNFSIGAAFSYRPGNPDLQIRRLERKAALGAVFAMTQPFFSARAVEEMLERTHHLDILIFPGIFPLISARNADFLHHEVPGISIPEELRRKLWSYDKVEDQRKAADQFTMELLAAVCPLIDGLYLISPLNKWEVTAALTREVRQAGWQGSGRANSHGAPNLAAAIGTAHRPEPASPSRLPQSAAPRASLPR